MSDLPKCSISPFPRGFSALEWRRLLRAGVIELTARDQKVFVQALLDPPKPNEKLRKAAKRCRILRLKGTGAVGRSLRRKD